MSLYALWCLTAAGADLATVIDPAESPERFRGGVLTEDAKVGAGAVALDVPGGRTSFHSLSLEEIPVDLAAYSGLAFWWRVEGEGLRGLSIKTRFPTMQQGRMLVFPVWRQTDAPAPTEWTPGVISFADLEGIQGDPSETRVLEFRAQAGETTTLRLVVDHVVALKAVHRLQVGRPRLEDGGWSLPLKMMNDGTLPVTVDYGADAAAPAAASVPAGETVTCVLKLPVEPGADAGRPPLTGRPVRVWSRIRGLDVSLREETVRIFDPLQLPPHPRLLVTPDQIVDIRRRCEQHDWAAKCLEREIQHADAVVARDIVLPPRGGVSAHYYANPRTGASLKLGKEIGVWQWEHVDRRSGEVFRGDPAAHETDYDGVQIGRIHARWARDAETLGLVYRLTGQAQYGEKARDILRAYAAVYLDYPLTRHGNPKTHGVGRATANYLTESTWLIDMVRATDMVWDLLTESDRKQLADAVFYPALRDSIDPVRCYVHNIQCWKNSAIGLVGLLLNDPALLRQALHDGAEGYWKQIEDGILPGGVWYEGSWGYHFYTMSALVPLTEACRNCGIDLYVDKLRDMYLAPTRFAMPDMRLPNFNDAGLMDLTKVSHRYELAAARWEDPVFRRMIGLSARNTREAMLYGVDDAAEGVAFSPRSANHTGAGYAILARGEGADATWLCLKYSPPSRYHGHPDRLGFILYARGVSVAPDPGSLAYGLDLQRDWYKTTLAHSTLTVDGQSQDKKAGLCLGFGTDQGVDYAVLEAGEATPGVRFVRTAALIDADLVVFVDQIRSDRERQLDIAYHQAGEWVDLPPGTPWSPPAEAPYRHLQDTTVRGAGGGAVFTTEVQDGWRVPVAVAPGEETAAITGSGPGIGGAQNQVPCLILRRQAQNTALVWAIALDGEPPVLEWVPGDEPRYQVATITVSSPNRAPITLTVAPDRNEQPVAVRRAGR
jgi:hypothetical protein